ncbi:hydrolase [Mycobacterium Phage Nergal]|nr:hydrolase [Mycobacterium Phage Nergal]
MSRNQRRARRVRNTAAALGTAAVVGTLCAAPALGATAFTFRGTDILSPGDRPEVLLPSLFGDNVVDVDYPASIVGMDKGTAAAVAALAADMKGVDGPIVIGGFSQGAIAVALAKQQIMALPPEQRPAADQLTFVTIGDPTNPQGILHWLPGRVPVIGVEPVDVPDTPYNTVIVNREYDGWADFPDRPLNLVADANAVLGIVYVHGHYDEADLDPSHVPAENVHDTVNGAGGHTTTYLVPTGKLPLVQPLRDLHVPEPIVRAIEQPLKHVVDLGYSRNDAKAADDAPAASSPKPADAAAAAPAPKPRHRASATRPAFKPLHHLLAGKPRHVATGAQGDADGPKRPHAGVRNGEAHKGAHEPASDAA